MIKHTIPVPPSRDIKSTLKWVDELYRSPESDHYTFDFGRMNWIEPFPLLFLSANIRRFRRSKQTARFTATNYQTNSYAAHMGFFEAFDMHVGNRPGEAQGSDSYLPITSNSIDELNKEAWRRNLHVGDVLEGDTEQLAHLLTQEEKKSHLTDTLAYTLREIMRNAVEHSESAEFEYCGQYWPTQDKVEVAILDCGIGVHKSLSANPNLKILSDDHGLRLALLPGISGKTSARKIQEYDHWANSGYGLYLTSRLCAVGGSFFICSGRRGLLRQGDGQEKYYDCCFQETALRMVLHTSSIRNLKGCLRLLRKEGEEVARRMSEAHPKASGASGGFRAKS